MIEFKQLTNGQHLLILRAYLDRLPAEHLNAVVEAEMNHCHACMNSGTSGQIAASKEIDEAVFQSLATIGQSDLRLIEQITQTVQEMPR